MIPPWANGLPWKPYEYRGNGTDTLTPDLDAMLNEIQREQRRTAIAALNAARTGRIPLQPCGTTAAYQRHIRRNEQPCEACAEASKAKQRERKAAGWRRR